MLVGISSQGGIMKLYTIAAIALTLLVCSSVQATETHASDADVVRGMVARGFSAEQIDAVLTSSNQAREKISSEFDKKRILQEDAIIKQAVKSKNLSAALDEIEKMKRENDYSDKWAMRVVEQVRWAMQLSQLNKSRWFW
jgi:hypothetical protein